MWFSNLYVFSTTRTKFSVFPDRFLLLTIEYNLFRINGFRMLAPWPSCQPEYLALRATNTKSFSISSRCAPAILAYPSLWFYCKHKLFHCVFFKTWKHNCHPYMENTRTTGWKCWRLFRVVTGDVYSLVNFDASVAATN